ncbi:MAG: hypothetical protein ACTSR8_07330 [Promethearchaeota archaeon]
MDIDPQEICLAFDKGNISPEVFKQINAAGIYSLAFLGYYS